MSHRVAVLIRREGSLLLIRRVEEGKEYYVVPGGGVEAGETIFQAAQREILEGLSLTIDVEALLWRQMNDGKMETYVKAANVRGEVALAGPELQKQSETNQYHAVWVPLTELASLNLLPEQAGDKIAERVQRGEL